MPRGGAREGSGRKPLPLDKKKESYSIYVSPTTRRKIQELQQRTGVKLGEMLDFIVQWTIPE